MNQYQPSIANQGFQVELPTVPVSTKSESSISKFLKGLLKVILIIGAIIIILPGLAIVFCLIISTLGSIGNVFSLLNIMGVGTVLFTGIALINNKIFSKEYLLLLIFAMIFSLLFLAGQYDVQTFNCPLHYNYNFLIPLIQLFVFIIGFVSFCYSSFICFKEYSHK